MNIFYLLSIDYSVLIEIPNFGTRKTYESNALLKKILIIRNYLPVILLLTDIKKKRSKLGFRGKSLVLVNFGLKFESKIILAKSMCQLLKFG